MNTENNEEIFISDEILKKLKSIKRLSIWMLVIVSSLFLVIFSGAVLFPTNIRKAPAWKIYPLLSIINAIKLLKYKNKKISNHNKIRKVATFFCFFSFSTICWANSFS